MSKSTSILLARLASIALPSEKRSTQKSQKADAAPPALVCRTPAPRCCCGRASGVGSYPGVQTAAICTKSEIPPGRAGPSGSLALGECPRARELRPGAIGALGELEQLARIGCGLDAVARHLRGPRRAGVVAEAIGLA